MVLWREAAAIRAGVLFRRVAVTRTKASEARRALAIRDLAYHARVDRDRVAAQPARAASVTYYIGDSALPPAAMRAPRAPPPIRAWSSSWGLLWPRWTLPSAPVRCRWA